jgi:hypothetical protein
MCIGCVDCHVETYKDADDVDKCVVSPRIVRRDIEICAARLEVRVEKDIK